MPSSRCVFTLLCACVARWMIQHIDLAFALTSHFPWHFHMLSRSCNLGVACISIAFHSIQHILCLMNHVTDIHVNGPGNEPMQLL